MRVVQGLALRTTTQLLELQGTEIMMAGMMVVAAKYIMYSWCSGSLKCPGGVHVYRFY